jgi:hypothetical protein
MEQYTFYKDNKLDQEFTLTLDEIKSRFIDWMKTKEKSWLEYYSLYGYLPIAFIGEPTGLYSTIDNENCKLLIDSLNSTKWEYLETIGIK